MKIVKGGMYILRAPWHSYHGKRVEVIMKRKGISESYKGETVYHVAFDPEDDYRTDDFDEEFVEKNFKELEQQTCVFNMSGCDKKHEKLYRKELSVLKKDLREKLNIEVIVTWDINSVALDYLVEFKCLTNEIGELCLEIPDGYKDFELSLNYRSIYKFLNRKPVKLHYGYFAGKFIFSTDIETLEKQYGIKISQMQVFKITI